MRTDVILLIAKLVNCKPFDFFLRLPHFLEVLSPIHKNIQVSYTKHVGCELWVKTQSGMLYGSSLWGYNKMPLWFRWSVCCWLIEPRALTTAIGIRLIDLHEVSAWHRLLCSNHTLVESPYFYLEVSSNLIEPLWSLRLLWCSILLFDWSITLGFKNHTFTFLVLRFVVECAVITCFLHHSWLKLVLAFKALISGVILV